MSDEVQEALDAIEQDYRSFRNMTAATGTFYLDDIGLVLDAARAATERLAALEAWAKEACRDMLLDADFIEDAGQSTNAAIIRGLVRRCPIQVEKETDQ